MVICFAQITMLISAEKHVHFVCVRVRVCVFEDTRWCVWLSLWITVTNGHERAREKKVQAMHHLASYGK